MHDQNDALLDTPKALLSLFLIILTSCFDLSNTYVYRNRTTFSFFLQKTYRIFKLRKIKNPLTVSSHIYIPRTVTDALSRTILTGNTFITVLVIEGGA